MNYHRYKVTAEYSGRTETEVLLPRGVEIESVSIRYGQLTAFLSDGDVLNMAVSTYCEVDSKRPDKIYFEKIDE